MNEKTSCTEEAKIKRLKDTDLFVETASISGVDTSAETVNNERTTANNTNGGELDSCSSHRSDKKMSMKISLEMKGGCDFIPACISSEVSAKEQREARLSEKKHETLQTKLGAMLSSDTRNKKLISITSSVGIVTEEDIETLKHKVQKNSENAISQIDLKKVRVVAPKYIEALISRQKRSDECIDISHIRSRTPKFDARKESFLNSTQLDEKCRPNSDPLSDIITIQLFDTTFNCTEKLGIADLLDTLEGLKSANCSRYYPK